ncbi:3'-5' exoribonuclease 1-like [Biomphalaria glabrata]|uniref:3'-5' exoribonuclease 1-like n=2 Tax=Biomphalaria glabrata TaxID=6526 RepID=A0A9W2YU08_BIOGL|nr:3'-5' exoribonuclease 1-like [Biomphalaria glabrata]XP_055866143.1 3'-5' exoribonuclease 1-like [Biomphalaria glabrata]XP_055866149.1 3'-5' exoribonuclease 1-like [Biomphalaria glabrata]KAI8768855.1 3'-5' exoribonuclease 1-like [Biomphalaria glabrata]
MGSKTEQRELNNNKNFTEQKDDSKQNSCEASAISSSTQATSNESDTTVTDCKIYKPKPRLDDSSATQTDDVMTKLSRINGAINRMTKEQLQTKLAEFRLNTCGVKDVLKKRLKNHYKRQKFAQCNRMLSEDEIMKFDFLVVIDYEATCSENNENFVHEIIEFPAVLVDTRTKSISNTFQKFCKPKKNPKLTDFCTKLTGITQQQVDKAKDFAEVFKEFEEWMAIHRLGTDFQFAILTDGPWDMSRFLKTQTELSSIPFPPWAKHWINLRKAYTAFYSCGRVNLHQMLDELGMKFEGRPHCGLDDARNIAAIAIKLLQDGCVMRINEHYHDGQISPRKSLSKSSRSTKSQPCQKSKSSETAPIEQEGENIEELLEYIRIQKS